MDSAVPGSDREWESGPPLGTVVQIAYLVDDLPAAAVEWATGRGAGPFLIRHHAAMACTDGHGRPGSFLHSSAYGQWGDVQVELVQVHSATPAPLAEELAAPIGVHHMATFVASFDGAQQRLAGLGQPAVMTATTTSGMRFGFHDARATLGHFLELYEPTEAVVRLYSAVRAAARDWDGSRPVRDRL